MAAIETSYQRRVRDCRLQPPFRELADGVLCRLFAIPRHHGIGIGATVPCVRIYNLGYSAGVEIRPPDLAKPLQVLLLNRGNFEVWRDGTHLCRAGPCRRRSPDVRLLDPVIVAD